jgi:cobalt/nickel transport system permease protein
MSRIDAALRELRSLDAMAVRDTPLARIDARAKVIATLAFAVTVVSFDRYAVAALLPLALYPLVLGALGAVPARTVLRKLALAAPFAALVGLFNPLLDRAPMLAIGAVEVSAGWVSFASIVLRFALTVGAALVLIAGTGVHALAAALGQLGAPQAFTMQLLFLYRYAFVLGGEAARMNAARTLRSFGRPARLSEYGPLAGHLLLRAFDRAQRVHQAMSARGFDGVLRAPRRATWSARDTRFVALWCAYFVFVRWVDPALLIGRVLTGGAQ